MKIGKNFMKIIFLPVCAQFRVGRGPGGGGGVAKTKKSVVLQQSFILRALSQKQKVGGG